MGSNGLQTIFFNGPLTTFFTPPTSCLSTTTLWNSEFFLGYQSDLGADTNCFPTAVPTLTTGFSPLTKVTTISGSVTTITTGLSTITPAPTLPPTTTSSDGASRLLYFSPGLCPDGYTYAATYTSSFGTASRGDFDAAYICCPSLFTFATSYGPKPTISYPICTLSTTAISNAWKMVSGWPTAVPSSMDVFSTQASGNRLFTVKASGIVVGWASTDIPIIETLNKMDVVLPTTPAQPPDRSGDDTESNHGLHRGTIVAVVVATVLGTTGMFSLGYLSLTLFRRHRERRKRSQTDFPLETNQTRQQAGAQAGDRDSRTLPLYSEFVGVGESRLAPLPPTYDDVVKADEERRNGTVRGSRVQPQEEDEDQLLRTARQEQQQPDVEPERARQADEESSEQDYGQPPTTVRSV